MHAGSRSNSNHKWFILICLSILNIDSYFCLLCPSALQAHMMKAYELSNTEFALFASISFCFAMIASLLTPYALKYLNIYHTTLVSCICIVIGQIAFIIGMSMMTLIDRTPLYLMYLGRIFIGIGYGTQSVTIFSTVHIWFERSPWLSFAMNIMNSAFEIGTLTTRYCVEPLFVYTDKLWMPYLIGVIFGIISVPCCVIMMSIENSLNSPLSISSFLDDDYSKVKHFNSNTWLMIIVIIIVDSNADITATLFTKPLMADFELSEWYVNILLSGSAVYALTIGQLVGYIISKYGYDSYYLLSSLCLMTLSLSLLYFYNINTWRISSIVAAWVVMVIYVIGITHAFALSYSCLFMVCNVEYTAIANSICAILCMATAMLQSYCFGLISDIASYSYAVLMCVALLFIGLSASLIVFWIDIKTQGPLHRSSESRKYQIVNTNTHLYD